MAKINLTERQSNAVNAPVSDILVSAAAGSGKTAVLTRRIVKNLTDADSDVGIKDMLIVTYTKAAAGELRSRISQNLTEALAADPSNKRLRAQVIDVERAQISTIHSFCSELIKEYGESISLPRSLKIAESAEIKLLYQSVMEQVIEERYERDTENFNEFVENFISLRDGRLAQSLLSLYEKLRSYTDGIEYVKKSAQRLEKVADGDFESSDYATQIKEHLAGMAAYFVDTCTSMIEYLQTEEDYRKQIPVIEDDKCFLAELGGAKDMTLATVRDLISDHKYVSFKRTAEKSDKYIEMTEKRKQYKNRIADFVKDYLSVTDENLAEGARKSAAFCNELYVTLKMFEERASAEKLRRSIMDYNDLEGYAHRLLVNDRQPSAIAREVARRYKQIYIDEYQDVSPIQDEIFTAIAHNNRFMVGDIKQSIYGFRGAAPELFASYRERFPDYRKECAQNELKIFLTENFRCDNSVIRFSNMVFSSLFKHDAASVPYLPEDALVFKKDPKTDKLHKVSIDLVEYSDDREKEYCEARYVALRVKALIASGVTPGSIAIMIRKNKGVVAGYLSELDRAGVRYQTSAKRSLFEQSEVMLVRSMIECIDNYADDIALSATLRSPVFAFTLDELAGLSFMGERCIYSALKRCAEETQDALALKCRNFLEWYSACRARAKECSSDEMIRNIYSELALEALVRATSDDPEGAVSSLNDFYQLAADYEKRSFKGLSSFVRHIKRMEQSKLGVDSSDPKPNNSDCVNVITVHQSKGLEYDYCFLCDLGRNLSNPDAKESLQIDRALGITLRLKDDTGYIKYDTPMRKAGVLHLTRSLIDEEMRVLYVALTRARHKLFVTARTADAEKLIASCREKLSKRPSYYGYSTEKSFIKWILGSCREEYNDCFEIRTVRCTEVEQTELARTAEYAQRETADFEQIRRAIDFEYPYELERSLPSKLAISALHPAVLDEEEDTMNRKSRELPDFMERQTAPTPAERGTATHLFMQFCDFDNVEKEGVEAELSRLVRERYVTSDSASMVYVDKVRNFFDSELYARMKSAKKLYREFRFNVLVDASQFTSENREAFEKEGCNVLVQGVIDCFFETDSGDYVIIDYKTDRAFGRSPEQTIADDHKYQLKYYKTAIEKITKRSVAQTLIYSFDLAKEISVEV